MGFFLFCFAQFYCFKLVLAIRTWYHLNCSGIGERSVKHATLLRLRLIFIFVLINCSSTSGSFTYLLPFFCLCKRKHIAIYCIEGEVFNVPVIPQECSFAVQIGLKALSNFL